MSTVDSFGAKSTLTVGSTDYEIFRIDTVAGLREAPVQPQGAAREPAAHRRRRERHQGADRGARIVGCRRPSPTPRSSSRRPRGHAGLHRRALHRRPRHHARGRRAPSAATRTRSTRSSPAEMVIDHSVIADLFGTENALERNVEIEYERNGERYQFLRWGQTAFDDFKVVPPGTGIVHQVNIEYLAQGHLRPRRSTACSAPTPTPASAPTRTPPWSTASACSAGASAASRPRPPCSASPSRCSSRRSSASSSPARSRPA